MSFHNITVKRFIRHMTEQLQARYYRNQRAALLKAVLMYSKPFSTLKPGVRAEAVETATLQELQSPRQIMTLWLRVQTVCRPLLLSASVWLILSLQGQIDADDANAQLAAL